MSRTPNSALADLGGKHRRDPVPPISRDFAVHVEAAFVKQILDVPGRQRETDGQHHRQADDLGLVLT